ncbi:MAG: signal recognition particle-docking protein FtsY [Cyanobacteriota bacterium]|nr:signal recognition particle-docking protein FtsY [Cyanobacteriota bacterium]
MPFNWFRRQQKDTAKKTPEKPTQETPQEEKLTEAKEESPKAAEDYLAWAKAAYKNIQKEEEEETKTESPEATDGDEVEAETTEATPEELPSEETKAPEAREEVVESPPEAEVAEEIEPEVETTAPVAEVAEEIEPEPEPEVETTAPVAEVAEETEPETEVEEPSAALPAWARSQQERQARLERLKETAIEEPEPEPETSQTSLTREEALAEFGDLDFDDGFLWSAEVLASQGRRAETISVEEITWLKKLRLGLGRTRRSLINRLKAIVGKGPLNEDAVMEIEALLLQADVGVEATDRIVEALQKKLLEETLPPMEAIAYLKQILRDLLDEPCQDDSGKPAYSFTFAPEKDTLNIWLITGVNGAGKTTTIGKIAHLAQKSDYRCLIGAADTFRAAAVEQVKIWGQRSDVEVIANPGKNTDPAAVVFDAIAAAKARNTELLIVDTAGRLQNKKNLMDELTKIRRVIDKKAPEAKVESLLVLDATLGQNGLQQAEVFSEAVNLSGVVLTKLDGTAKGGIALAVVQRLGLPIRFIGVGESIEDLRPFSSYEFVEALVSG